VSLWQNGTAGNDAAGRSLTTKTICDGLIADSFLIVCFLISAKLRRHWLLRWKNHPAPVSFTSLCDAARARLL
jgi:hypothetical protein